MLENIIVNSFAVLGALIIAGVGFLYAYYKMKKDDQ
jgi:hypothetical protein